LALGESLAAFPLPHVASFAPSEIASREIQPEERVTYSNRARKVIYRDADGFGGAPA
jgi:hypothetical protein